MSINSFMHLLIQCGILYILSIFTSILGIAYSFINFFFIYFFFLFLRATVAPVIFGTPSKEKTA